MTRKAILLSVFDPSVGSKAAELNSEAWHRFVQSNCGGAWSEQEIIRLDNCDRKAALGPVRAAKGHHYSLLVFAGHGEIRKGDLPWPEAHVRLNDGSSLSQVELNSGTPRCTMVFDWSNGLGTQGAPTSLVADQGGDQFRSLFDQTLQKAEGGLVKIYASKPGDTLDHGPSFSSLLLSAAHKWASTNHGVLSLQQAVSLVIESIPKTNPPLNAEYQGGRRLHHFPLAVSV